MKVPSRRYCMDIYERFCVPSPVRRHCLRVAQVGLVLVDHQANDSLFDREVVERGCLIHDAFKAATLAEMRPIPELDWSGPTERELRARDELRATYPALHETEIAARVVSDGYPEFSDLVRSIGSTGNPAYLSASLDVQVMHYADWRVQLTDVVSFDERLDYLGRTYATAWKERGPDWWSRMRQHEVDLEARIFQGLPFSPDDLCDWVPPEGAGLATIASR